MAYRLSIYREQGLLASHCMSPLCADRGPKCRVSDAGLVVKGHSRHTDKTRMRLRCRAARSQAGPSSTLMLRPRGS